MGNTARREMFEQTALPGPGQTELATTDRDRLLGFRRHLTRQEFRAWWLADVMQMDLEDVSCQMGFAPGSVWIHTLLRQSRAKLIKAGQYITSEQADRARVYSQVMSGLRCPDCHMMQPCRFDGLDGPCDARSNAVQYMDRYINLLDFIRHGCHNQQGLGDETQRRRTKHGAFRV